VLLHLIYQLGQHPGPVSFDLFSFRKGPLSRLAPDPALRMTMDPQVMIDRLGAFPEEIAADPGRFHVLLIDDLGVAFATNNTPLTTALNQFNDLISLSHHENFLVVIADLVGNLKSSQTFSSSFIKTFQQCQTGMFLSTDDADMAWFNTHVNLQYRKQLQWLPGRGFLVFKGRTEFLQTPLVSVEEVGRARRGAPGV